jgi:hypothetical protein
MRISNMATPLPIIASRCIMGYSFLTELTSFAGISLVRRILARCLDLCRTWMRSRSSMVTKLIMLRYRQALTFAESLPDYAVV